MTSNKGQLFVDCIVCSKEIIESDLKTEYKIPTSSSAENLLHDLLKILKISPTIFYGIDLSLLPSPVYCSSCRDVVFDCLQLLHQIQCLESNMGELIKILKGHFLESFNKGIHDYHNQSTVTVSSRIKNEDGNGRLFSSSDTDFIKYQIRKTFAQCWASCKVKLDRSSEFPTVSTSDDVIIKSRDSCKSNAISARKKVKRRNKALSSDNECVEELQIEKVEVPLDIDEISVPDSPFDTLPTHENVSDPCTKFKYKSEAKTKVKTEDNQIDSSLHNLRQRRSPRTKRNVKKLVEIIIDESEDEDMDMGVDNEISDSGSVYLPDSNSNPASPEPSYEFSLPSRHQPERKEHIRTRKKYDDDDDSKDEDETKPKKKWMNGNGAAYQRQYRKQKKLNRHMKLKYICHLCGASYNFLRSLKIHENRHLDDGYFTCIFCNELFYTEDKLCSHEVQSHEFLSENHDQYAYNIKGGILESYKCRYCETPFDIRNYSGEQDQGLRINCEIEGCTKTFSNFRTFQLHHDNTCLSIPQTTSESALSVDSKSTPTDVAAARRSFILTAQTKESERPASDCPRYANGRKKLSRSRADKKLSPPGKRTRMNKDFKYECDVCGKGYNQSQHYNGHMKSHQSGITAECDVCGEKFISEVSMRMHKSKTHINCIRTYSDSGVLASFKCSFCKKEYVKSEILEEVEGEKGKIWVIKCDIGGCTSTFPSSHFLQFSRHHQKSCDHKPQQPPKLFQCESCDKIFGSQTNLDNHTVSMHTKNYPYYCDECGRGKVSLGQLNRHKQLVHSGMMYECEKCQQRFKKKELYTIHMRRHNNDLRHMCGQCGKRFLTARHLKFHETTHMDDSDRKFPCRLCGKLFKAPHYVRKHIWSTHKKGGKKQGKASGGGEVLAKDKDKERRRILQSVPEEPCQVLSHDNESDLDLAQAGVIAHGWQQARRAVDLSTQDHDHEHNQDINVMGLQDPKEIFGLHFPSFE